MARLVSVSRAARLVGVTRGALQKRILDGEIESFEGKIRLDDLTRIYPNVELEDNSILERIEHIIEQAAHKARTRAVPPDVDTLAKRVNLLSDELAEAKLEISNYENIIDKLKARISTLADESKNKNIDNLQDWFIDELSSFSHYSKDNRELIATDTFLSIMTAQVHLKPSDHEFFVEGNNSILESGLSAGLALNYGCSNGNCGKCKARVLSGEVKQIQPHDYLLTEAEKIQNYILMCSNTAVTDTVLEADEASNENEIPQQEIIAKIRKIENVHDNILVLHVKTPRIQRLRFLAGQSLQLEIPSVGNTTLPIASCPCDDMNLQFHIQRNEADAVNTQIFTRAKNNDPITLRGPQGHFVLNEDNNEPIIFIAFCTGFAPIKSLIEHAMTLSHAEFTHLYWVVENQKDLYQHNLCRSWSDAIESFHYSPLILSQDQWNNVAETVRNAITSDHATLAGKQIYMAGPEKAVQATSSALTQLGAENRAIKTEFVRTPA